MRVRLKHRVLARKLAESRISQNSWARRLGLNSGHLSKLANGKRLYPGPRTRQKLLRGLGLEFDELFELETGSGKPVKPAVASSSGKEGVKMQLVDRLDSLRYDLAQGLKSLRKSPAFAFLVVATIGLGIGANTAVFGVVNSVLLKPLPLGNASRLLSIWTRFSAANGGAGFDRFRLAAGEINEYRRQTHTLDQIAAFSERSVILTGEDSPPQVVWATLASSEILDVLGETPILGRFYNAEEDVPNGPQVAVIAEGLWERHFGRSEDVLEKSLIVNGESLKIIGVVGSGFRFPETDTQIWIPLGLDGASQDHTNHNYRALGLLSDGASPEQAKAELKALMGTWKQLHAPHFEGHELFLRSLQEDQVRTVRPALLLLLGGVGLVLLITCVNLANLLITRTDGRSKEIAIRSAVGAPGWRLAQQFLVENWMLTLLGGLLGLALCDPMTGALMSLYPDRLPPLRAFRIDASVLLFAFGCSLLTGTLLALLPTLTARSVDLQVALKSEARGSTTSLAGSRFRQVLVIAQLAVCMLLVVGAGLLLKSFVALNQAELGFDASDVVVGQFFLPVTRYPEEASAQQVLQQLRRNLEATPATTSAGVLTNVPLSGFPPNDKFQIDRHSELVAGSGGVVVAGPGAFEALDVPLVEGRFFEPRDRARSQPVVIVSRTLARAYWPGISPLGQRMRHGPDYPWMTVVGVVEDVRYDLPSSPQRPVWYVPSGQALSSADRSTRFVSLFLEGGGDTQSKLEAVRRQVWAVDADLAFFRLESMESVEDSSFSQSRFSLTLMGMFALAALVLGALGIYGVMAHMVSRRRGEIGIRMTLGASTSQIRRMVVGRALVISLAGLLLGWILSFFLAQLLSSLLYGVSPGDPATMATSALLLLLIALGAAWLPSRQAAQIDPLDSIRQGG